MHMLNIWGFKNTFANKLVPHAYSYLKNGYVSQKKKDFSLSFAKTVYAKNTEIINHYISFIDGPFFHSCLTIEENDWLHPFPHGYIPNNFSNVCTNIAFKDRFGNLRDTVEEKISINLHKPSPYKINGNYSLVINNRKIENNVPYEVPMDFRGIRDYQFTDDKQYKIFINKLNYYLNSLQKK